MQYIDKFRQIRPFVKLNIPHNKKMFTKSEKARITKYHNQLKAMGYFNREQEGFILKDISRSKYTVKNAPRIKKAFVNVGTRVIDGKIETDTRSKAVIRNGKIYVKRAGMPYKWEFEYNINRDWKLKEFTQHLIKQMRPNKPKKNQIYVIGAGIYEMRSTNYAEVERLAKEILKFAHAYNPALYKNIAKEENLIDENPDDEARDDIGDFMYRAIVYENEKAFAQRIKERNQGAKRKKRKGRK